MGERMFLSLADAAVAGVAVVAVLVENDSEEIRRKDLLRVTPLLSLILTFI